MLSPSSIIYHFTSRHQSEGGDESIPSWVEITGDREVNETIRANVKIVGEGESGALGFAN